MKRKPHIFVVLIVLLSCLAGCIPATDSPNAFKPAPESERVDLVTPTFSDPTNITNPLFPVSLLPKTFCSVALTVSLCMWSTVFSLTPEP